MLEFPQLHSQTALDLSAAADDGGGWRTINGVHVEIGGDGTITKGPAHMVGKKESEMHDAAAQSHSKAAGEALKKGDMKSFNEHTDKAFKSHDAAHDARQAEAKHDYAKAAKGGIISRIGKKISSVVSRK